MKKEPVVSIIKSYVSKFLSKLISSIGKGFRLKKIKSYESKGKYSIFNKIKLILINKKIHRNSSNNTNTKTKIQGISFIYVLLRKLKIKTRLITSFIILLFAVILITGVTSYKSSTGTIDNKVKVYSLQVMDQTSVILNNEITRMEAYINDIGLNSIIQQAVITYRDGAGYEKFKQVNIIDKFLMTKFIDIKDVAYCGILHGEDFSVLHTFNTDQIDLDTEKVLDKDIENLNWSNIDFIKSNENLSCFGIQQNIKAINGGQVIAKMILVPKTNYLADGFMDLNIGTDADTNKVFPIIVIDGEGNILASRDNEAYEVGSANDNSKLIANGIKAAISKNPQVTSANLDINISETNSLVTFSKINTYKDWYVVSAIPYNYLNSDANDLRTRTIVIGFICILVAFLLCLLIAKSVEKPLAKLVSIMKKAKDGDLTEQVQDYGSDEIADVYNNYNDMILNISSLISKVRDSSQRVFMSANRISTASESTYTASGQVAQTVGEIAKGSTNQAEEISNSVIDMNRLSEGIALVEDNVAKVIEIANKISNLNANASSTINDLNGKSAQVSHTTNKVCENITDLSKEMNEIQKIVKIMIGISEQTTLLSLNASIEAARAGEAGRGFAVVASEVKKLADKAKEFSGNINSIISSIGNKTNATVEEVKKSMEVVSEQIGSVKNTEILFGTVFDAMGEVVSDIKKTEDSVQSIMTAKDNVIESMENISAVAEQSAATAEEIYASTQEQIASAEDLSSQAKELKELADILNSEIDKFRT